MESMAISQLRLTVCLLSTAVLSACVFISNETAGQVQRSSDNQYEITASLAATSSVNSIDIPTVTVGGLSRFLQSVGNGRWVYNHTVPPTQTQFQYSFSVDYTFAYLGFPTYTDQGTANSGPHQTTIQGLTVSVVPVLTAPSTSFGTINLSWTFLWPVRATSLPASRPSPEE